MTGKSRNFDKFRRYLDTGADGLNKCKVLWQLKVKVCPIYCR